MYYAIGDIHGEITLLKELYNKILNHYKDDNNDGFGCTIVFLGDYVDRGEDNKAVVEFLMALRDDDIVKHIFLIGNHEQIMMNARSRVFIYTRMWLENGGQKTLDDFGTTLKEFQSGSLDKYIEWFEYNLVPSHIDIDYIFCHGGVDTKVEAKDNTLQTLMWKRSSVLGEYANYNKVVIHGHTPTRNGLPLYGMNEVNVDTGCPRSQVLTAVVLPHCNPYNNCEFEFLTAKGNKE